MSDLERLARRAVGGDAQAALNLLLAITHSGDREAEVWPVMRHGPDEEEAVLAVALSKRGAEAKCAKLALTEAHKDGLSSTIPGIQIRKFFQAGDYEAATAAWNEFCESEYREKHQVFFSVGEPIPVVE